MRRNRRDDPGHYSIAGPDETCDGIVVSTLHASDNWAEELITPLRKSSIAVLSPRLEIKTARRIRLRRAVSLSPVTLYGVFGRCSLSSNDCTKSVRLINDLLQIVSQACVEEFKSRRHFHQERARGDQWTSPGARLGRGGVRHLRLFADFAGHFGWSNRSHEGREPARVGVPVTQSSPSVHWTASRRPSGIRM